MRTIPNILFSSILLGTLLLACLPAPAQIQVTQSGTYTQNFASLPGGEPSPWTNNVTLPGWYSDQGNSSPAATQYLYQADGEWVGDALYFFPSGSSNALGSQVNYQTLGFGVSFENTSGNPMTFSSLSYLAEQWAPDGNGLTFYYGVSASPITNTLAGSNWTAVGALNANVIFPATTGDGTAPQNQETVSSPLDIVVPSGQYVMFAWKQAPVFQNGAIGIDDLSIAYAVPEPSTWAMLAIGGAGLLVFALRQRRLL